MFGLKPDVSLDIPKKYFTLNDYEKGVSRWCPGCGDHAILSSVQKLCREYQLAPEKTVFVSGIGCSSRFPHYMQTYGFHGLHGRAFPVACGIKFRRPDLAVFAITGDGDCCSIGAGPWIHAIRYNMDMVVLLFDNEIYGLTKKQTSPTTPVDTATNTHPHGAVLPPINPIQTTLGVSNVSFVAQTIDWNPAHMYATIKAAYEHPGFAFVRVMQRCPVFMPDLVEEWTSNRDLLTLLEHDNGIKLDENIAKSFHNRLEHDSSDIVAARAVAENTETIHAGLFYQNKNAPRYDLYGAHNINMPPDEKVAAINAELDRFTI
jgi:2-oxoglutarate/2-oxoacid ferredoxin oxidoreductase subunit beta